MYIDRKDLIKLFNKILTEIDTDAVMFGKLRNIAAYILESNNFGAICSPAEEMVRFADGRIDELNKLQRSFKAYYDKL